MMKYGQMTISVEFVTPGIAKKWLEQNSGNRRLRVGSINQYARDMASGHWERKPVAIAFDDAGILGNGQHTLSAIVASNLGQELLVARNVPRKSIAAMDRGRVRTLSEIGKFLGAELESRRASIARIMAWGPRDASSKSFAELLEVYEEHAEVIDFVCAGVPRSAGLNAAVLSVCAKAAYTQDRIKIQRFLEVLRTGMSEGEHESAAIRLRDFTRSLRGSCGLALRDETYTKSMSALNYFLNDTPINRLCSTSVDYFPISPRLL